MQNVIKLSVYVIKKKQITTEYFAIDCEKKNLNNVKMIVQVKEGDQAEEKQMVT